MDTKITIGISACLLGKHTRYDGGHRHEPLLIEALNHSVTLVPLCPEAECGLGIPREPMRLEGDSENPRLITIITRRDLTKPMLIWAAQKLDALAKESLDGLILKSRSPSCGKLVAVHREGEGDTITAYSPGLFVRQVMKLLPGLPIADEEELRDLIQLANFLKRIGASRQNTQEDQQ